jgi:hypothetical protein
MTTFDDITFRRPKLADSYLALLKAQPGRPLALFAPRRVGKTHFLTGDLTPVAEAAGMLPVYADLWLSRNDPLAAINHALEEALDDVLVPKTSAGKTAKTTVKKVTVLGTGVDLGDTPARRGLPADEGLRFDALITRLAEASGKQIMLMLDEFQAMAKATNASDLLGKVRAVLQKHKTKVFAVFTGSSQAELGTMMASAGAPMYQFTQLITFPNLDIEYLTLLANHYQQVHKNKSLVVADLERIFAHIGWKPAMMKDLVKVMSADGITDVDTGLKMYLTDTRYVQEWQGMFNSLQPLDQAVLVLISHGIAPLSKQATDALRNEPGLAATTPKIRYAVDRLRGLQILEKPEHSTTFALQDQLFADYLSQKYIPHYLTSAKTGIANTAGTKKTK